MPFTQATIDNVQMLGREKVLRFKQKFYMQWTQAQREAELMKLLTSNPPEVQDEMMKLAPNAYQRVMKRVQEVTNAR